MKRCSLLALLGLQDFFSHSFLAYLTFSNDATQTIEKAKNIDTFFTNKDWYLGLRNDNENREYRQEMIPIGLPFDKLWMRMLDDPNKKESTMKTEELDRKGGSIINKDLNEVQEIIV